jgi:hypothetical protein
MKQYIFAAALILILSSCTTYQAQALVQSDVTPRPSVAPSATIVPSATIDYEATIEVAQAQVDIAQATADEARRVNAMATTEYMALVNEQLRMTAEIDRQEFEILMITATMAGTSIPLTQTQQAAVNTQVPAQQAFVYAQMTATEHAPTQMVAMLQVQNYQAWGGMDYQAGIFGKFTLGVFLLFLPVAYILHVINKPKEKEEPTNTEYQSPKLEPETTFVHVISDKTPNKSNRFEIPCTPEQLTEFAVAITQGQKTMAINSWEGKETSFTRPIILQLRSWARNNDFATPTEDNQLAPTNDFLDFLCGWLNKQRLPTEYEFAEKEPQTPSPIAKNGHESHEYESFHRISA